MYITLNSVNQSLLTAVRLTCDERVTDKKSHPLVNISCESGAVYVTGKLQRISLAFALQSREAAFSYILSD